MDTLQAARAFEVAREARFELDFEDTVDATDWPTAFFVDPF
jgi:hypothetical protein